MADFFLDVSAVGNEYQAYADTPASWGVPQDGNGKAANPASAAVAVATIDVAGCTASGSGAIGVLGTTVSSTLNASGAALATAIAAAINATATAVTSLYCLANLPLNRLVYARVNPSVNTQVQIMLRVAGVDWNGMAPTQSGISPAATVGAFAGGTDGPFGYFVAPTAAFGKAMFAHGIFCARSSGSTDPAADGSDPIITRTKRGGSNIVLTLTAASTSISVTTPASTSRSFLFDDGTTWAGDDGQLQVDVVSTGSGNFSHYLRANTAQTLRLVARKKYGFRLRFTQNGYAANYDCSVAGQNSALYAHRVDLGSDSNVTSFGLSVPAINPLLIQMYECRVKYARAATLMAGQHGSASYNHNVRLVDCDFEWDAGGDVPALFSFHPAAFPGSGQNYYELSHCRFSVDGGAHSIGSFASGNLSNVARVVFAVESCKGLRNMSLSGAPTTGNIFGPQLFWSDADEGRGFRYDTPSITVDWEAGGVFPSLTAVTPEDDPFCARLQWGSNRLDTLRAQSLCKIATQHELAAGVRTIDIEFLAPSAEVPTGAQLFATIKYTGADGGVRYATSLQNVFDAAPLPAGIGLESWALAGLSGLSSHRIRFTTEAAVKHNTEVSAELYFGGPPATSRLLYLHPELVIA